MAKRSILVEIDFTPKELAHEFHLMDDSDQAQTINCIADLMDNWAMHTTKQQVEDIVISLSDSGKKLIQRLASYIPKAKKSERDGTGRTPNRVSGNTKVRDIPRGISTDRNNRRGGKIDKTTGNPGDVLLNGKWQKPPYRRGGKNGGVKPMPTRRRVQGKFKS